MADYRFQNQRPALPPCSEAEDGLNLLDLTEPAFLIDGSLESDPLSPDLAPGIADYLAHAVAAAPNNLLRHTQRIFHHYRQNDQDGLYAALVDLFIALGPRGYPLRRRLLNGARKRLRNDCYAGLERWLGSRCAPDWSELSVVNQSVLVPGIIGIVSFVRVSVGSLDPDRDPLVEAREHIEYCQLDQARAVLEDAIAREPDRADLQAELLELYQATRDLHNFLHTRDKLQQLVDFLPMIWNDCERYLRKDQTA